MTSREQRLRPPTLRDVAALANVSRQTISRVINNKGEVSEATKQRVLEAIRELGYQPNSLARSLVTTKTSVIGLVVPDITQPFYPVIARGIEYGAQEAGYSVFLCNTESNAARERQALERLRGHRVDGVIICNSRLDDESLEKAVIGAFPVVLINRELANVPGVVIWPGYDTGTALAVAHLRELGRRNIAYLGLDFENRVDRDKERGFRNEHSRLGMDIDERRIIRTQSSFHGGYNAMQTLVEAGVEVDAIVAFNDLMAVGAMRYAATHGINVPDDLALVGFGGTEIAAMVTPSLSTISVPLHSIGLTAVQGLLELIEGTEQNFEHRYVNIQPELIIRGSSVREEVDQGQGTLRSEPMSGC